MSLFWRLPLSRKILLGIMPLFLVFISISVVLQNHFQEKEMMEQAQASAHTYGEIIRESLVSMMVNNYEVDSSFLERVNALQQFDTVHILTSNLRLRQELLTPKRLERLEAKHRNRPIDEIESKVLATGQPLYTREGDHFRAVIPFNATNVCQKCHAVPVGYTLGATDLHISFAQITKVASGNWKRSFTIFLLFIGLAVAIATFMFTRYVSRPIEHLVTATKEISRGNLEYRIPYVQLGSANEAQSRDELNFLAAMFDAMRESLQDKISQLDHANTALSARNAEIEEALQKLKHMQDELIRSERLAVTGKMTAQLSHEINNPIHNIQSLLESSLRKLDGNEQTKELIGVALEEVTRMAKLTRQMLDFYRGSLIDIPLEPVDVRALLTEMEKLYAEPLSKQCIALVIEAPSQLPILEGSRDKLKQVFINLIKNARDAMPKGGIIRIGAEPVQGGISIMVSDTGSGIPVEDIGKIFDAFFTTKKDLSGVGLGLSVSYGIIQQHRGSIAVKSKVGEGTTFTIQLPITREVHG